MNKKIEKMAKQCAALLKKRDALEAELPQIRARVIELEKARIMGEPVNMKEYRKAREQRGDCESQITAVEELIRDLRKEGEAALLEHKKERLEKTKLELKKLEQDEHAGIEKFLVPLLAQYIAERERVTGVEIQALDWQYLIKAGSRILNHGIYNDMLNDAVARARTKAKAANTAQEVRRVEEERKQLNQNLIPDFEAMVEANLQ